MHRLPLFSADTTDAPREDASGGAPADPVRVLLELPPLPRAALRAGSVRLAPGERVPAEGDSAHAVDELSLIVAGSLAGESGGAAFRVGAGEVTLIPAGEAHWAVAGEDGAEIFWLWFGNLDAGS